jgi:hypothetical protein
MDINVDRSLGKCTINYIVLKFYLGYLVFAVFGIDTRCIDSV